MSIATMWLRLYNLVVRIAASPMGPAPTMAASTIICSSLTPSGILWVELSANGTRNVLDLNAINDVAQDPAATANALSVAAVPAASTTAVRRNAGHQQAIADCEVPYRRSDSRDGADGFVAEDPAIADFRYVTAKNVQVDATDGDGVHPDDGIDSLPGGSVGHFLPSPLSWAW